MKKLSAFSKPLAWLIVIAVIAVAVLGIGGIKLNAKYRNALRVFNHAINTPDSSGNTFQSDYVRTLGFAAPIEACAARVLGSGSAALRLTECLAAANACRGDAKKAYPALAELHSAVINAYEAVKSADPASAEEVDPAYSNFRSNYRAITNTYAAAYAQYNDAIDALDGGFPASLIRNVWGIGNDSK